MVMSDTLMLGKVTSGKFVPLGGVMVQGGSRLTRIAPFTSSPPESEEIEISEHEGRVLLIRGNDQGAWIYSASILEVAGLILSIVVKHVFGRFAPSGPGRSCRYGRSR
jgi:hypothetical protein